MSNRKHLKKRPEKREEPKIYLNEENKVEVSQMLGYPLEWAEEALAKAKALGYSGVSFPIPPGR